MERPAAERSAPDFNASSRQIAKFSETTQTVKPPSRPSVEAPQETRNAEPLSSALGVPLDV
ncbi:MAG: hypothetical protein IIW01_02075 [Thermoguttaceae bacterium]|nr:hypothetical protein [Thermoguttaceae bacterium]